MGGTPLSVVAPQNYYECATFQMTTRTGQGNRRWGGWGHIQRNCCAGASTRAWFSTLNSLDSKGSSLPSSSTSGLWKVTSEERTGLIKNSRGNNKNWNVEDLKRESYTNRQKWIQNLINSRHQFTENLFTGIQFLPRVRTPRYTVVGFQFLSPPTCIMKSNLIVSECDTELYFSLETEWNQFLGDFKLVEHISTFQVCATSLICWSYYIVRGQNSSD